MVASQSDDKRERAIAAALAAEVRHEHVGTTRIAFLVLALVLAYLAWLFAGRVDGVPHALLFGGFALTMAMWLVTGRRFGLRQPDDAELVAVWLPRARAIILTINVLMAASVWVLMPAADLPLRYFMIVLYTWFIVVQAVTATEATQVLPAAVALVLGSLIAWCLVESAAGALPHGFPLAVCLLLFGASMIAVRRLIRGAVVDAVAARAALETALAEVAAQRDAKTRFIANASHDLQQPIQAARLFVDRALGDGPADLRARALAGAQRAFASVEALIGAMLDHLRLEAGAAPATIVPVPLAALVAEIALEHEAAAGAAGAAIRTVATGHVVAADRELLRRVLANLVGNAIRHAGARRILIGARSRRGGWIDLWVIDDGRGIAASDAARVFEDYAQAAPGSRGAGGFGIGLSSVRRMLALFDGSVTLDPRWRGAAFRVRLRAARAGTGAGPAA